uniref:Large ribosomal subunit protein uL15 n=1 Tax=Steinernema glaseri TaxID=37863 RepID=A0A1I7XW16_9BILA
MRNFHLRKNILFCPTINVDKVWSLVPESVRLEAKKNTETAPVIDITRHGYHKLLGKGVLPKQPLIVKAKYFSHKAEEAIKKAGGACILVA